MEVSITYIDEILNYKIWKKVFPFAIDPRISTNEDVFSLVDLPDEPVLDQWECFYSGLPNY
jgi:hypothetical protein